MKQRGLTLIELVILLAIACILISVALPILFVDAPPHIESPKQTPTDGPRVTN